MIARFPVFNRAGPPAVVPPSGDGPANLLATADNVDPTLIDLSWDNVSTALFYEINRAPTSGGTFADLGTNTYVMALDLDNNLVSSPSTMDASLDAAETAFYRVRAFKSDYTYTDWSSESSDTTVSTAGATFVSTGAELTTALANHTNGTPGLILIDANITAKNLSLTNAGQDGANKLVIMSDPAGPRRSWNANGTAHDDQAISINASHVTLAHFNITGALNRAINHAPSGTADNFKCEGLTITGTGTSTNNISLLELGVISNSTGIIVRNCVFPSILAAHLMDMRHMDDVLLEHNEYYVQVGEYIKFTDQPTTKTFRSQHNLFKTTGRWICDGYGAEHFHNVHDMQDSSGVFAMTFGENSNGSNQKMRHLTLVNNTGPEGFTWVTNASTPLITGLEYNDCFLANNTSNVIQDYGQNTGHGASFSTSFAGATSDCVNFAGDDFTIGSGSSAYRAGSSGFDYGAFIPAVGAVQRA